MVKLALTPLAPLATETTTPIQSVALTGTAITSSHVADPCGTVTGYVSAPLS